MHILTMLMLLSILILVHEFGHFYAARKLGLKVDKFGFGLPFGPTLYQTKWKDVTICVHAFLLGGYVSFPDDDPESDIPKDSTERINNRAVWERFIVISAGVTANAIMAYLIVLLVAFASHTLPSGKYNVYIAGLQPDKALSSHHIGLKSGDKIVSVNGGNISTLNQFIEAVSRSKKYDNYVAYEKIQNQTQQIIKLNPEIKKQISSENALISVGTKIILPAASDEEPISVSGDTIDSIKKYTPEGKLLSNNERSLRNLLENKNIYISEGKYSLSQIALATADTVHPVILTVSRNGQNIKLKPAYPNAAGMIGVQLRLEEINEKITSPVSAVSKSWTYLRQNTSYMVRGLGLIITGQIPLSDVHGIVAITKVGSDIIEHRGIWDGLLLMALISMDLAIVNLLPIPALDGGHLLFLLIEKLRGKPVEEKVQEAFAKYGFAILMGLMVLIIFNDVFALVTDKL